MSKSQSTSEQLLTILEGTACRYCADGTLEERAYKGNDAVVCSECHTPGAQVW